ncbi:MAG: TRAP transporter large permease subunit [Hyphomicrobiaceae bacterium]
MTDPHVAMLMLSLFIVVILLGFPVAFTLMALGVGFGYFAYYDAARMQSIVDNQIFGVLVDQTYSVMSSEVLTAVPLFLFMGYVVERSNIVERMFSTLQIAAKGVPGAMAVAALLTCALFASATGLVGAVVSLMGVIALPQMLKARYDATYAAGVICAGGCLGILMPPSVMLIVYSATTSVSVTKLLAGALLPGLMLAGLYVLYVVGRAVLQPSIAPRPREDAPPKVSRLQLSGLLLTSFVPLAVLVVAVLGAMLLGLAKPAEAAAIGALGSLLLAIVYRELTWDGVRESVYLTLRTTAVLGWLFVGSWTFSSVFSQLGGEQFVKDFVLSLSLTPLTFLILTQVVIFLLGWPLEWPEIVIVFVPLLLPLVKHFGIDPLVFGVLIALNLQMSFLTPPRAIAARGLRAIAPPDVKLGQVVAGSLPYFAILVLAMVLVHAFPGIALWLPEYLYGK